MGVGLSNYRRNGKRPFCGENELGVSVADFALSVWFWILASSVYVCTEGEQIYLFASWSFEFVLGE